MFFCFLCSCELGFQIGMFLNSSSSKFSTEFTEMLSNSGNYAEIQEKYNSGLGKHKRNCIKYGTGDTF